MIPILRSELDRNFEILSKQGDLSAYYLDYSVTDLESKTITATLGAIRGDSTDRTRRLDISLRVGSPDLDNYHPVEGRRVRFTSGIAIAVEDAPNPIRQALWRETDRIYRLATQRLIRIRTDREMAREEDDAPADFSVEEAVTAHEPPPRTDFEAIDWLPLLRDAAAVFANYPLVIDSEVSLSLQRHTKYFINSEGSELTHGWTSARISIQARGKAPDGMDLVAVESFEAIAPDGLPGRQPLIDCVRKVADAVSKQVDALPVEPYVGPAILSNRAAGVFFHEIFGHRVEGHRLRNVTEGQTFSGAIGTAVLPEFLSVVFDPTRLRAGGRDLMGWYSFDDQGVPARKVPVIEDGVMKTFLMSRSPVRGISNSNGHGRRQSGNEVVSRQSNLIVESSRTVSDEELHSMLIEEVKRQNKPYGYFFEQVTGGFTLTGRRGVQAFKVIPLVVYRVYPDGRPDELVRGADIVGTPLAAFSKIVATGDNPGVFNGYCGAESGNVPVSAVSPALLVSEIEIQRKEISQDRAPILSRPRAGETVE